MSTVTASNVRDYFRSNQAKFDALPEAAQRTVQPGARGRLHADAVKAFNAKRAKNRRYVTGASKAVRESQQAEAKALRQSALDAGLTVGKRGPLSKAALASLKG